MNTKKAVIILIIIGLVVYFNSLFNGFVWDDEEQILNNIPVHSISSLPQFFSGSTFNTGGSGNLGGLYYKPLMTVSFSSLYTLFGPQPFFFHFFQLLLHIGNAILVFLLFKRLMSPNDDNKKHSVPAFVLALIFLIHPINTEAVVYASDLQDIQFFFFGILALIITIRNKLKSLSNIFLVSLFLLLSLLSKETGILFVLITGIYTLIFFRRLIWFYILSASTALGIYSLLRFIVAGIYFNKHGLDPITTLPLAERALSIPKIIFSYLRNFVFPKDLAINQHWVVTNLNIPDFYLPLLIVVLLFLGLLLLLLWTYKQRPLIFKPFLFFFIWFVVGLGMHLQIFPLDLTISDRWFYMPIIGLLGMAGVALGELKVQGSKFKVLGITIIILILIGLSIRTMVRNTDWKNGLSLYSHDVSIAKDSFDLENNLGVELFRAGKLPEAKIHFTESTELAPNWWTSWNNLGVIVEREGDFQKAKEYYKKAIDNGKYYMAYENYANILLFRDNDPKSAKLFAEESLKILPYNAKLWMILSIADYQLDLKKEALTAAQNAYQLAPSDQTYYIYSRLSQNQPLELK